MAELLVPLDPATTLEVRDRAVGPIRETLEFTVTAPVP